MKILCGLCLLVLCVGWGALPSSALALEQSKENALPVSPAPEELSVEAFLKTQGDYTAPRKEAFAMMGHVAIANIALTHGLYPDARANVRSALARTHDLEGKSDELAAGVPVKLGKIMYRSRRGIKDFGIPLVNDVLTVRTMDENLLKTKKSDSEVADAQVLPYTMLLNLSQVQTQLEEADAALKQKNYGEAEVILRSAVNGTFYQQQEQGTFLQSAQDHLSFAKALVKDKNYRGVFFALGHTEEVLHLFENLLPEEGGGKGKISQLQAEIAAVSRSLDSSDPSTLNNINQVIVRWKRELDAFSPAVVEKDSPST